MSDRLRTRARPARRYYFAKEVVARRRGEDALADAWRAKRLAEPGTALPAAFPGAAAAAALGVLALEDLDGMSARALEALGFRSAVATAIHHRFEGAAVSTLYFQSGPHAGEPYDQDELTLLASAAKTTSGVTDWLEVGDRSELRIAVAVTAISGTGARLAVQIETRRDSSDTDVRVVDAFPAVTATGTARRAMAGCDRQVRARYVIDGSGPSVTFAVTGEGL